MKRFLTCALLCTTALAVPIDSALAQSTSAPQEPPPWYSLDGNGVDLAAGSFNYARTDISIGPSADGLLADAYKGVRPDTGVGATVGGLSYSESGSSLIWRRHSFDIYVTPTQSGATVVFGKVSDPFTRSGSEYVSALGRSSHLADLGGGSWSYTSRDGTVVLFRQYHQPTASNSLFLAYQITSPNGLITSYAWKEALVAQGTSYTEVARLQGMSTSRNYALKFDYASNDTPSSSTSSAWLSIIATTAINIGAFKCDLTQDSSCSTISGTRTVRYGVDPSTGAVLVTDPTGQTKRFTYDAANRPTNIRLPASSVDDYAVTYDDGGRVATLTRPWGTWTYSWTVDASLNAISGVIVTDPTGVIRSVQIDPKIARATSDAIAGHPPTTYQYSASVPGQLALRTAPEGNSLAYQYDARGNITQITRTPKPGSSLAAITTRSVYPAVCSNMATCNKPTQTIDAEDMRQTMSII